MSLKTKLMISTAVLVLSSSPQAKQLIDPTRPGVAAVSNAARANQMADWNLTGIVTGDKPFAIIDDQLFQIGEPVHGVKITAITTDTVSLADGRTLKLFQSITEQKG